VRVWRAYTKISTGQVHYRFAGTAGKPVLVLLHQTPSTSAMYEALMLAMANDYRLFAPDLPGMGQSDPLPEPMTIGALAGAITEFLDELCIDRCSLFGHHTGASIAAEVASNAPARVGAVALCGPPLLDDALRERLPALAAPISPTDSGAHFAEMWGRIHDKDRAAPLRIVERETLNGIALGETYADAYQAVIEHDMDSALAALACPALVFAGTADPLYRRLDATEALLSRSSKREIDGAGTFVCETHCREVAGLLGDFFAGVAA
jgi:pimeloyl-ACP methyl ester carboxylesterase